MELEVIRAQRKGKKIEILTRKGLITAYVKGKVKKKPKGFMGIKL